jgi:hypothetical protein
MVIQRIRFSQCVEQMKNGLEIRIGVPLRKKLGKVMNEGRRAKGRLKSSNVKAQR